MSLTQYLREWRDWPCTAIDTAADLGEAHKKADILDPLEIPAIFKEKALPYMLVEYSCAVGLGAAVAIATKDMNAVVNVAGLYSFGRAAQTCVKVCKEVWNLLGSESTNNTETAVPPQGMDWATVIQLECIDPRPY